MISQPKTDYIRSLADADGYIEPSTVVEAARDPSNILHDDFDWDVDRAAEAHWLDQARRLIRYVKVEITVHRREVRVVGFVKDPNRPPKSQRYIDITLAARERDRAYQVVLDEMSRITSAVRRAKAIALVCDLEAEFDLLLDNVHSIVVAVEAIEHKARGRMKATKARGRMKATKPPPTVGRSARQQAAAP